MVLFPSRIAASPVAATGLGCQLESYLIKQLNANGASRMDPGGAAGASPGSKEEGGDPPLRSGFRFPRVDRAGKFLERAGKWPSMNPR